MVATKVKTQIEGIFTVPAPADLMTLCRAAGPCVSIILNPHRGGAGSLPSGTVLAGMLPRVAAGLQDCGMHPQDVAEMMEPLEALGSDPMLTAGHGESLCIYRSPRQFHCFLVRADVEPGWHVEERFVVMPLLAHLDYRQTFLLLALAEKRVRLLRCEPGKVEALPIPDGVPESTKEFAHENMPPDPSKNHMMGTRFGSSLSRKERHHFRQDFMKAIDRGLLPVYRAQGLPLVIAGVEEDTAAYATVSEYAELLPEPVQTSPDGGATDLEMARAAEHLMRRWSNAAERQAMAEYHHSVPLRCADDCLSVMQSALAGRVQHLFVSRGAHMTGNVQRLAGRAALEGYVFRNDNLVNAAAVETLLHKGSVWLVQPDRMPDHAVMAAVLRYAGEPHVSK